MDEIAAKARQDAIDKGWKDVKEARGYMPNSSKLREDARTLQKNQDAYLGDLSKETAKMKEKAGELQAFTAKFVDASGKIKTDELKACSNCLDQARFDRLVLMILGRNDTLDRVRGLSDELKEALLNHEAEQAETRHKEEVRKLKQELDNVRARVVNSNQLLSNKSAELETVKTKLADLKNQSDETIGDLNGKLTVAEAQLAETKRRLSNKASDLSRAQDDLSSVREQLKEANSNASNADSRLQGAEVAKNLVDEQIKEVTANYETARAELVRAKGELETTRSDLDKSKQAESQASRRLETAEQKWSECETALYDVGCERDELKGERDEEKTKRSTHEKNLTERAAELEKVKEDLAAQHAGLASFFSGYAGFSLSDAWRSLATTIPSADWIAGIPTDERPWTVLPAWYGESLVPLPEPTASMLELLLRLHGAVSAGDFGRGSTDLVRHLINSLVEAPALPVALLVDVANKALVKLDDVHLKHSVEKQLFNMAFRLLLKLVQKRWPCPDIEPLLAYTKSLVQDQSFACIQDLEAQVGGGDHASLRQLFADSRDATGDMPDRNTPFFLSGHIGLLRAAEDHIWALDLDARTVRLIHSTRGKMIKDVEYVFRSSESAGGGSPDLSIPIEHDGEYFWLMDEWARAIESAGDEMSQYSEPLW